MQIKIVTVFSLVLYLSVGAVAEDEIKRGTYPFMAFIYYQDETVLGLGGGRFLQGAVLIRPSFLITSSPESTISKDPLSKTLLARLGATIIDAKFTFNEDEDEQEQEVIEIIRPYEHDSNQWWLTDLCLLKTLEPVVTTSAVRITQLSTKQEAVDKVCHVLIYKKKSSTEVRLLTRLYVEMLPASTASCGENFVPEAMTCATDQASSDGSLLPADFCRGNNGGPLICDNDVIALQTYIDADCKAPHLYQLLSPRKRFLDCGIDGKCGKVHCHNVCSIIRKDAPLPIASTISLAETVLTESTEFTAPESSVALTTSEETTTTSPIITTEETESTAETTTTTTISTTPESTTLSPTPTKSWPNERDGRKNNDEDMEVMNRTVSVEAQSRAVDDEPQRHVVRSKSSTGDMRTVVYQIVLNSVFILYILA